MTTAKVKAIDSRTDPRSLEVITEHLALVSPAYAALCADYDVPEDES